MDGETMYCIKFKVMITFNIEMIGES